MKKDYDFIASIYDPVLFLALNPIRIAVMNELVQSKEKSILDLCCGTGNQLKILSKNGFKNLHCLDISNSMLEIVKRTRYPINIYNEDATETDFENESFDIVIISFAIHEKDRLTQEKLLNEAHRILIKEGTMLIVDFIFDNKTSRLAKLGISSIERIAGKEHYNNFKSYIESHGLSGLIKKEKFMPVRDNRKLLNGVTISKYKKVFIP